MGQLWQRLRISTEIYCRRLIARLRLGVALLGLFTICLGALLFFHPAVPELHTVVDTLGLADSTLATNVRYQIGLVFAGMILTALAYR